MTVSVEQRLRAAAAALTAERVSLAELLQAHGPAAPGSLLLLMAVPCLLPIPGTGTVLGLGLLALSVAMWRGQHGDVLPRRVAELRMSLAWARRALVTLASVYGLAARVTRARLGPALDGPARGFIAASVALMAVVLVLPIPFGNVLPALALVLIGLGLVFRDGVAVLLGLLSSALTAVLTTTLLVYAADWGVGLASQALS